MRRLTPTLLLAACGLAAMLGAGTAQTRDQILAIPSARTAAQNGEENSGSAPLPKVRHGTPEFNVEAPPAAPQPALGAPVAPKTPPATGLRQQTLHQGELKHAPDPNAFKRPQRDSRLRDADLF